MTFHQFPCEEKKKYFEYGFNSFSKANFKMNNLVTCQKIIYSPTLQNFSFDNIRFKLGEKKTEQNTEKR